MKVSDAAKAMIKHHEGVRMRPYRCPALLWTVGVGHVIDPAHAAVKYEDRKTYLYPMAGIGASRWERWTLSLLKTLRGLSAAWPDFALLLLIAKANLTLW
jgi:hypothetical protein